MRGKSDESDMLNTRCEVLDSPSCQSLRGVGMTRRDAIGGMALASAAALAGCGKPSSGRYRFRMTVEVDTPQGLRSGSSVMEVSSTLQWQMTSESSALVTGLTGEAVIIDVMPGQTLFALIGDVASGDGLAGVVTLLFEPNYTGPESFVASVGKLGRADQRGRTVDLPPEKYPTLVRFRDAADPKTIEPVLPEEFAKTFGPRVSLRRISATITDSPITRVIGRHLPDYSSGSGFNEWYGSLPYNDRRRVTIDDFKKGN